MMRKHVVELLQQLSIRFDLIDHPATPTVADALPYWKDLDAQHCKNLFFRNHKGNQHYLVVIPFDHHMQITQLEKDLKQGKLSFASPQRLHKYLKLEAGMISPFGLIYDQENHVKVYLDQELKKAEYVSFHPNDNTATLRLSGADFIRYLKWTGNPYEWISISKKYPYE